MLEEIPPRDAVLGRERDRLGPEDRGDVGRDRRELVGLHPEHDDVGTAGVGDAVGRLDPRDDLLAALFQDEAALADHLQVLAARDDVTFSPAAASLAAIWPPIAPAPMTVMFIRSFPKTAPA